MSTSKIIVAGVLFLLPFSAFAAFDTNLKYGAKGTAVTELQEFLVDQGYLSSSATGNFYSLTLAAVKKFQTASSLPSTGYFGPMSRDAAQKLIAADLTASDNQETQEVGSVSAPVNTNSTDQLNQKIVDLTAQVAQQTAQITQQKAAQDDTNIKLGQIVENTTPAVYVPPQIIKQITATINRTTVPLNNHAPVFVNATYSEDGKAKITDITMTVGNQQQVKTCNIGVSKCLANFDFIPTELGDNLITLSANGTSTAAHVLASTPQPVDPVVSGENLNAVISHGTIGVTIGKLSFGSADETYVIRSLAVSADSKLRVQSTNGLVNGLYPAPLYVYGSTQAINISADAPQTPGVYSVTITGAMATGEDSGAVRNISGFPITFTFTVQ